MIEWVLAPLAVGALGVLSPKFIKLSDRQKIDKIVKNMGLGVVDKDKPSYVKFKYKNELTNGKDVVGYTYKYSIPFGLGMGKIAKAEKELSVFSNGLRKPVEVEVKEGFLHIHVYDTPIPKKLMYKDIVQLTEGWTVPIGMHYKGLLWHDFSLNPHIIVGGATGYGKTVVMKNMMTYLIENNPEHARLFIIDLKGGLEFWKYRNLRQVLGVSGDAESANEMFQVVLQLMMMRFRLFKEKGWSNINETPLKERIFIFVDEAAQLIPEKGEKGKSAKMKYECQEAMEKIAALGRAVGVHLIFGTQYPTADALPKFIKQNTDTRIGFRLGDGYASEVVLGSGNTQCAELPYKHPGRCIYKADDIFELQVPYITDKEMWKRLEVYNEHEPVKHRKEETETRKDTVDLESLGIRNEGTTTDDSQTREIS